MVASGDRGPARWWQVKRRLLRDPITLATPLRTELGSRPHTQAILIPRRVDGAQKAMAWLLGALVAVFVAVAVAERLWTLALIAGALAVLLGFAVWLARARARMAWSATWHRDRVVVHDGRYGPPRTWEEPLSAFAGVTRRRAHLSRGNEYTPDVWFHGVVLEHPALDRSVLLHAQPAPVSDDLLADYARQLGTRVLS